MVQALGLTHWKAAACQKLKGLPWARSPLAGGAAVATLAARYSRYTTLTTLSAV